MLSPQIIAADRESQFDAACEKNPPRHMQGNAEAPAMRLKNVHSHIRLIQASPWTHIAGFLARYFPFTLLLAPSFSVLLVYQYMQWTGGPFIIERIRSISKLSTIADLPPNQIVIHVGWQIADIFFLGCVIIALVFSIMMYFYHNGKHHQKNMAAAICLLIVVVSGKQTFLDQWQGVAATIDQLLFQADIDGAGIDPKALRGAVHFAEFATVIAFSSLAFAAYAIIDRPQQVGLQTPLSADIEAQHLANQISHLRTLILIGSAVLFLGVIALQTSVAWRASLVDNSIVSHVREHVREIGKVMILIWVAVWTLCLALLYLPCAAILRARVEKVFQQSNVNANRQEWLDAHGLQFSAADFLIRVFALFGPIVTTTLTPLQELIKLGGS